MRKAHATPSSHTLHCDLRRPPRASNSAPRPRLASFAPEPPARSSASIHAPRPPPLPARWLRLGSSVVPRNPGHRHQLINHEYFASKTDLASIARNHRTQLLARLDHPDFGSVADWLCSRGFSSTPDYARGLRRSLRPHAADWLCSRAFRRLDSWRRRVRRPPGRHDVHFNLESITSWDGSRFSPRPRLARSPSGADWL